MFSVIFLRVFGCVSVESEGLSKYKKSVQYTKMDGLYMYYVECALNIVKDDVIQCVEYSLQYRLYYSSITT